MRPYESVLPKFPSSRIFGDDDIIDIIISKHLNRFKCTPKRSRNLPSNEHMKSREITWSHMKSKLRRMASSLRSRLLAVYPAWKDWKVCVYAILWQSNRVYKCISWTKRGIFHWHVWLPEGIFERQFTYLAPSNTDRSRIIFHTVHSDCLKDTPGTHLPYHTYHGNRTAECLTSVLLFWLDV